MLIEEIKNGHFYLTKWNFECIVAEINEKHFKHGQGLKVFRIGDNQKFFLHPTDLTNEVIQ